MSFLRAAAIAVVLVQPASAATFGIYTDLVVFGDSLSDPGNVALASPANVPSSVYPNGQFTNGDVWAAQLGTTPALRGGTNFAFGGARTVDPDANPARVPDFADQRALLASAPPALGPRPLVAIWFGGNDLRDAFTAANPLVAVPAAIATTVGGIVAGVSDLIDDGFDDFLVFGQGDLGLIPQIAGTPAGAVATGAAQSFNAALQAALQTIPGPANVQYFDIFAVLTDAVNQAASLGITQPFNEQCALVTPPPVTVLFACGVENGDDYLFYDSIHPSEPIHAFIADAVRDELPPIPLPAGLPLLIGALGALAVVRRARA